MLPVIAIVGRPNVGKSTLFNRLTNSRKALIADQPGVTRDRQYGHGSYRTFNFVLVDTGGIDEANDSNPDMAHSVTKQTLYAIREADIVIWLVDGREGLTTRDENLARQLRPACKRLYLVVNKTEGLEHAIVTADFHALGMGHPYPVSAERGSGMQDLFDAICMDIALPEESHETLPEHLKLTVIGRPNVGKSTLVNRILGEERMLTLDQPGTTRDSISVTFERGNQTYILVDTAGVRRKSRIDDSLEKASVIRSLRAMEESQVIILVLDARQGISDQDATLLGLALESGKALVIAVNKWDGLDDSERDEVRHMLDRKLGFIDYASIHYISALHGSGVGNMFGTIRKIERALEQLPATPQLNRLLKEATDQHTPPTVRGRRIKLRYIHIGGRDPFRLIIHGNQLKELPDSYRRYLSRFFREALHLNGIPVIVDFKQGDNPFKDRKNTLTRGQSGKRSRLPGHSKKNK